MKALHNESSGSLKIELVLLASYDLVAPDISNGLHSIERTSLIVCNAALDAQ